MSLALLPPAPRKAKTGRLLKKLLFAFFLFAIGAGILFGLGTYSVIWTRELLQDRELFAQGEKAEVLSVEGTQRSRKFIFHEYDLTLTYLDKKNVRHTAKQDFISAGFSVDENLEAEVRYDPANPDRAVCSWSVDVTAGRVIWCILAFCISLIGALLYYAVQTAVSDAFLEQKAAREGLEVRVEVSETSRDEHGNISYALRAEPTAGEVLNGFATLRKASPLWIGNRISLGLYLPEKRRIFLVESDGLPVVLTENELWQIRKDADALLSASGA